jgi:hypothetical protein
VKKGELVVNKAVVDGSCKSDLSLFLRWVNVWDFVKTRIKAEKNAKSRCELVGVMLATAFGRLQEPHLLQSLWVLFVLTSRVMSGKMYEIQR